MEKNSVYELSAQEYNLKLAEALKKIPEFKSPEWVQFVKSGSAKERPINDENFWHKRAASILRQIYRKSSLGVNRLRTKYGSKKNRGMKPERFRKAGGKIIRTILQQCDAAGFTEIQKPVRGVKSKKPGRILTKKGKGIYGGIGMKEYRVVNGTELIRGIFKDMKKTDLVKSAYSGQQILNILDKEFNGVIYEPGERKLIISGDENNSLIKRFYELISLNKIRLEPILKCR